MDNKRIALIIFGSIIIFAFGMILFPVLLLFVLSSKEFSLFHRYMPSICTMFIISVFLTKMVGVRKLIFSTGTKSVKAASLGVLASLIYSVITNQLFYNPLRQDIRALNGYKYIAIILLFGLLGPIFEEIVFRAYVFEFTRRSYGVGIAWCVNMFVSIASHYVFALDKINIPQIMYMFVGVSIITFTYQYGGLYASITVHGFMNISGFT